MEFEDIAIVLAGLAILALIALSVIIIIFAIKREKVEKALGLVSPRAFCNYS